MARTISLDEAKTLGGNISNVELNSACVVTITSVEERVNPKSGKSYFLCATDAEVFSSPMRVVLNGVGTSIASINGATEPEVGTEIICWVAYGDETADGKKYLTLYPKGHPKFGM